MDPFKKTRRLIWLYFILLIFEGALRKWVVPSLANPLLIIRDPLVILIYISAMGDGSLLRYAEWVITTAVLGAVTFLGGFLSESVNVFVMGFGLRTNFLHLPLIFVIAAALNRDDVVRLGKWVLIGSMPMAFLMLAQFRAGPDHWLNAGAGENSGQIISAMGKVRASGTFSFITGTVSFYSMTAAFLLFGQVERGVYPLWLSLASTATLLLAAVSSGSRTLLAEVMIVGVFFFVALALHPPSLARAFRVVAIAGIGYLGVSVLDIYKEATLVMKTRIELASTGSYSGTEGYIRRISEMFKMPIFSVPVFGLGFGRGTNAGAAWLGAKGQFLVAENEWERIVGESGPLLGLPYVALRVALAFYLWVMGASRARFGNLLPFLLVGSCFMSIVNGQFGPPTILGFAVFVAGCSLAATNITEPENKAKEENPEQRFRRHATEFNASAVQSMRPDYTRRGPAVPQPGRWAVRPDNARRDDNNS